MGAWAWLWMGVWVVALLVAVWLIVREPARRPTTTEDALAILRVRYARGEITRVEFEQARHALLDDEERTP